MFTKAKEPGRQTLLRYWTTRYLITLVVGLLVIALISAIWIRKTTIDNRLNLTQVMAQELADRIVTEDGQILIPPVLKDVVEERSKLLNLDEPPSTFVVDPEGNVLSDKNHFRGDHRELSHRRRRFRRHSLRKER
ncbi:hypothetical protein ACPJHQ_23175 [Rossellomorea sp. H39__3]